MPSFCAVIGCANRGERDNVRFFRIPAVLKHRNENFQALSRERRQFWVRALMRGNLNETFLKHARICSKHFITGQPADLEERNDPDWVPSQNMGYTLLQIKNLQATNQSPKEKPAESEEGMKTEAQSRTPMDYLSSFEEGNNPDWVPSLIMGYTSSQIKNLQATDQHNEVPAESEEGNNPDGTPPQNVGYTNNSQINNQGVNLAESSLFSRNISLRETPPQKFTPSTPAAIEIATQIFNSIIANDRSIFRKTLLPEYLSYYITAMIWLRILSLKKKNLQALNREEKDILIMIQSTRFVVPEPILLQLQALGNIKTLTGQHLCPEFPPLPTNKIKGFGGHYGIIAPPARGVVDDTIHNLYEEIPCLGTVSYAVCKAISDDPPGSYRSLLTYGEGEEDRQQPVNCNLLGFRKLGYRLWQSKKLALDAGITSERFPSFPENTGFNLEFLIDISNVLANTRTFKMTMVDFAKLSPNGAQSQIVIELPRPISSEDDTFGVLGNLTATCLIGESDNTFGSGIFFCQQLMKESIDGDHKSWCIVDDPPEEWVANRNDRRNLPLAYMQQAFVAESISASLYRDSVFERMVVTQNASSASHQHI